MAADCEFTSMVHRLACLRGISTLTAFALAVEVGDWDRFTGASIGADISSLLRRVVSSQRLQYVT
jgi:transposase